LPFERCAATARRVKHAVVHHLPGIKQSRKPQSKGWGFLLCGKRQIKLYTFLLNSPKDPSYLKNTAKLYTL